MQVLLTKRDKQREGRCGEKVWCCVVGLSRGLIVGLFRPRPLTLPVCVNGTSNAITITFSYPIVTRNSPNTGPPCLDPLFVFSLFLRHRAASCLSSRRPPTLPWAQHTSGDNKSPPRYPPSVCSLVPSGVKSQRAGRNAGIGQADPCTAHH